MSLSKELSQLTEKSNPDLEKAREEIDRIKDQLSKVKEQIHKNKEAGKSDSVIDTLKKQWQSLQDKIVQVWKQYDQKHGTKYSMAYESLKLPESLGKKNILINKIKEIENFDNFNTLKWIVSDLEKHGAARALSTALDHTEKLRDKDVRFIIPELELLAGKNNESFSKSLSSNILNLTDDNSALQGLYKRRDEIRKKISENGDMLQHYQDIGESEYSVEMSKDGRDPGFIIRHKGRVVKWFKTSKEAQEYLDKKRAKKEAHEGKPGYYVHQDGEVVDGPYDSRGEAEQAAMEAISAGAPESDIHVGYGKSSDKGYFVHLKKGDKGKSESQLLLSLTEEGPHSSDPYQEDGEEPEDLGYYYKDYGIGHDNKKPSPFKVYQQDGTSFKVIHRCSSEKECKSYIDKHIENLKKKESLTECGYMLQHYQDLEKEKKVSERKMIRVNRLPKRFQAILLHDEGGLRKPSLIKGDKVDVIDMTDSQSRERGERIFKATNPDNKYWVTLRYSLSDLFDHEISSEETEESLSKSLLKEATTNKEFQDRIAARIVDLTKRAAIHFDEMSRLRKEGKQDTASYKDHQTKYNNFIDQIDGNKRDLKKFKDDPKLEGSSPFPIPVQRDNTSANIGEEIPEPMQVIDAENGPAAGCKNYDDSRDACLDEPEENYFGMNQGTEYAESLTIAKAILDLAKD